MASSSGNGADLLTPFVDKQKMQPAPGSCIMLPPEVLSLVCGLLPKCVLKRVRQVSKIWERAAVPHLFNEIFISQDVADFRIAKLVMLQFKHYIRTLVFSSVYYTDIDRASFKEEFRRNFGNYKHSGQAFRLYRIKRKNQQDNKKNGSSSAYLSSALTSLPNVRKIILTDTSSSRSMPHQSRRVKATPSNQCDLTTIDDLPDNVWESGFFRKGSTNPWRLVLSALSVTNANVKELTMEPGDMELGTNTAAFSMSLWNLNQSKLCFHTLTKIRFSLFADAERFSTDIDIRHVHQNVAKLLRSAVNLESLSLDVVDQNTSPENSPPALQEILGQCKFPKLRTLNLAFFVSSEVELLQLLISSKNIENLILECYKLTEGLWMRVADCIRATFPLLKHAELTRLYGGFDEPWEETQYMDFCGHIDEFLFAQGENPFTTKALERYHADIEAKPQVVKSHVGLGFICAYKKYH